MDTDDPTPAVTLFSLIQKNNGRLIFWRRNRHIRLIETFVLPLPLNIYGRKPLK